MRGGMPPARAAAIVTVLLLAAAFIGRSVISWDAAEAISDTLGFLIQGRFEAAKLPSAELGPESAFAFRSHYGLFPSLLLLPFTAVPWAFRRVLGPTGLDAGIALAWATGALLAVAAFRRLARVVAPGSSPWWAPAFLASTFLWAYAADSFFETFAAAGLAFAAAEILEGEKRPGVRSPVLAGAAFSGAALLKPVLWILVPAVVLGAVLAWRGREGVLRRTVLLCVLLCSGLAVGWGASALRFGGGENFGYGDEALRFTTPLLEGLYGLLLSPGRGLLFFAPLALVGAARLLYRGAPPAVRVLCGAAPLLLLLTVARFEGWHGGSAWGPRHALPVLPLLVAPALLARRRASLPAVAAGVGVNALGVLVAAGAWMSWVELWKPPAGASWPRSGPEIVSVVPSLSPIRGHAFLLGRSLGLPLASPAARIGATERVAAPGAEQFASPAFLRALLGLPPMHPMVPSLLHRIGAAYALRGDLASAAPFLREALALAPGRPGLRELLGEVEARTGPSPR